MSDDLDLAARLLERSRAKAINASRPAWVMVGLDWDGPGVLLLASDQLGRARLDFDARQVQYRDVEDLLHHGLRPSLELSVTIVNKDGYLLVAAPDWASAIQALLAQWSPGEPARPASLPEAPREAIRLRPEDVSTGEPT